MIVNREEDADSYINYISDCSFGSVNLKISLSLSPFMERRKKAKKQRKKERKWIKDWYDAFSKGEISEIDIMNYNDIYERSD